MIRSKVSNYKYLYVLVDALIAFGISLLAFLSYYRPSHFGNHLMEIFIYSGVVAVVTPLLFAIFKVYRIITKNIGIIECIKIMVIALCVQLAGLIVVSTVPEYPGFREFVFIWFLASSVSVFLFPSVRVLVRVLNIASIVSKKTDVVRTIVIGAGESGKVVIDETRRNVHNNNKVVAVVDDDYKKIGASLANVPVKGPISNIAKIIEETKAEEVIIAISSLNKQKIHEIVSLINNNNIRIKRLPLLSEMEGPNDVRVLNLDLDELLCRPSVALDNSGLADMVHEKTVLITGAGGSIGSELVRQIFRVHPKNLVLFDIYENGVYELQMDLKRMMREENITDINLVVLIGSTYNEIRVEQLFRDYRPDYVFHAAAYKHVPLMEDSPAEAIRSNVIGTYNVAKMADKYAAKKMILVSTDKAVRPTNVMGATKRFAETIIQYFAEKSKNTKFAAVRFGNVLYSNGSVVPLFESQIAHGGPLTLTHEDINRFFMTIPEASSLILQCGLFAEGGEIFILDMGNPVKIKDLAEKVIRQCGLVPYKDIKIDIIGLRPGEKLYEELLLDKTKQRKTANDKIFVEPAEKVKPIEEEIKTISRCFGLDETKTSVKELLASIIDTYKIDRR